MAKKIPTAVEEFAAEKNYFKPDLKYLFGQRITEYDISQANISVLYAFGRIDYEDYVYLSMLPKDAREVEIGKRIKNDYNIQSCIDSGIEAVKLDFLKLNNINLNSILRIANDAIYLIGDILPPFTSFSGYINPQFNVVFKQKHTFNAFTRLGNIIFFSGNGGDYYDIDVIGINNNQLYRHEKFMLFIANIMNAFINGGQQIALREFNNFYNQYVSRILDIEYYYEFRAGGGWRLATTNWQYIVQTPPPIDKVDINYNLRLLRELYSYLMKG